MKKRIILAAIAVILVAAIACTLWLTLREGSRGILYRVTGDGATAYLLGSIHIGTSTMYPFGDTLKDAMASSDTFVFESDTASETSLAELRSRQALPGGITLRDVLGDALYEDVGSAYGTLGLRTDTLSARQPWAVISTLAVYSSAEEMGVQDVRKAISLGVEAAVLDYADSHHKQFAYLETVDEVADTMDSFSDALTRYLLQDEIDVILGRKSGTDVESVAPWPAWWRDGDADAFRDFYQNSFEAADPQLYAEYQEKLVTRRNILMAGRLDAMLKTGGTYFVTVGLLHLVSADDSIPALLREMGYMVERVSQP